MWLITSVLLHYDRASPFGFLERTQVTYKGAHKMIVEVNMTT